MAKRTGINVYEDIVIPHIEDIKQWFSTGLSLSRIADKLGISHSKLWEFAQQDDKQLLKNALTYGELANANVENGLYSKCVGYYMPFRKGIKIKEEYYDTQGRKCTKETVKMVDETMYYPPDFQAQRYWLNNRMPDKWRGDDQHVDNSVNELLDKADNIVIKIREIAQGGQKPVEKHE